MKKILAAAVITLMLTGCNRPLVDEFRNGLPKKEMVEIQTPANESTAPLRTQASALRGEQADSYRLTRGATVTVNAGTLFVLGLIKGITDHPASSIDENTAVWGPSVPDALDPHIYRLTVTKTAESSFSYALEGKDKTLGDEAYVVLISGTHQATATEGRGSGSFLVDFDAAATLPEHSALVGTVTVDYSRAEQTDVITVAAEFTQVNDGHGGRDDFSYRYTRTPAEGGTFDFMATENIHSDGTMSQPEKLTVRSRWTGLGAGRADLEVSGGELDSPVVGSECWDTAFDSQYLEAQWAPAASYGDEQTDCAFTSAEYSSL